MLKEKAKLFSSTNNFYVQIELSKQKLLLFKCDIDLKLHNLKSIQSSYFQELLFKKAEVSNNMHIKVLIIDRNINRLEKNNGNAMYSTKRWATRDKN